MSDERKKPWYLQLPAKAGAVVVFLVALTTLAGNLLELNDKRKTAPTPAVTAPEKPANTRPAAAAPTTPRKLRVSVDRIAVQHDGSPGTTDWRFSVEADGEPLFAFQQDDLDDTGGRNVAMPRDIATDLRVAPDHSPVLTVKAWRGSRFRLPGAEPDAVGQGVIDASGAVAPLHVAAPEADAGAFVLYLSTDVP